jgi:hypothetical protein
MKKMFFTGLLITTTFFVFGQHADAVINAKEVERIERTLSSDDMRGRRAFTPDIDKDADFIIEGYVDPNDEMIWEGPFGDHLGYYSLAHPFPVLNVDKVYHRMDAIWPFTVVGRPPQEDTIFGQLIHELTGPVIPTVLAGGILLMKLKYG